MDALWLHTGPPDYTFRLPKLHLCILGVNRSGKVPKAVGTFLPALLHILEPLLGIRHQVTYLPRASGATPAGGSMKSCEQLFPLNKTCNFKVKMLEKKKIWNRMTASVLKQDPNTKVSNEGLFILTRTHSMQIVRELPFIKPQSNT